MTMLIPTGATVAVDPSDAVLITPNGASSSSLYLASGAVVVVAALPAALAAELDAAAGLTGPDTLWTTPVTASDWTSPVRIAGTHVKRIQASGSLGSMVTFASSPSVLTAPATTLAAMLALVNATSSPAPAGAVTSSSDEWIPALNDTAAVVTFSQPLSSYYTRVNGTTNVVTAQLFFGFEATANGTPVVDITNWPFPLAGLTNITLQVESGAQLLPSFPDVNTLRLTFAAPLTIGNAGSVSVGVMYEPAP